MSDNDTTDEMSNGVQGDLFHPESDREPGDTNIQKFGLDIHPVVFPVSLVVIVAFVAVTIIFSEGAAEAYTTIFEGINGYFGWFYILAVNLFIVAVLYFALSKYGHVRLGGVEAEKEFSDFAWIAMLFSAGMGIGLVFFSVAEPMWHFGSDASGFMVVPPVFGAEGGTTEAATAAIAQTFFHWGFHPWAIYGLVGLGLAFFTYNRGLPLTVRSIFWPLLGERIYGWPGHIIDLITVFATLFGLSTSLGLGVKQVNAGLSFVFGDTLNVLNVPTGTGTQIILIAVITLIATASVAAGLESGIKRLSTINVYLMLTMLAFVLVVGPVVYIFGTFTQGLGVYFGNFFNLSFFTSAIGGSTALGDYTVSGWMGDWTVFYWGWWIAWSPFVGMFIARISKGRTVREFILGVLLVPTLFSFVWLATFGGSALWIELVGNGGIASALAQPNADEATATFTMLDSLPLEAVSGLLITLLVVTFFVTSSDSGSLVIDHITSGGKHDAPKIQRIFWAIAEGAVAAALLYVGGLDALRTASIATGLPFALVLCLACYTVYRGLDNEYEILKSKQFTERIDNISEKDGVSVTTTGDETVIRVKRSGDAESSD